MRKNIILAGQLITSRTETLEDYLRDKAASLAVIGITSPFAAQNHSRCTLYEKGVKTKEFSMPSFQIGTKKYMYPLLFVSFLVYFFSIIFAALRFKKKFDLFIGVACFSTYVGTFLKRFRMIRKLIYYSIDYYPPPPKRGINTLNVAIFRMLDRACVKYADITWHISARIPEARQRFSRVDPSTYRYITAPLTYSAKAQRFIPVDKIERWTIGFVGSLSPNQGLQLAVRVIPEVIKEIPQLKVRIIGRGIYEAELKKQVARAGLDKYFIFHGFIQDENQVLEILSRCAVGIAPWDCSVEDNILYADPGKPKLYAFCGIPIIMTNGNPVAQEIADQGAGIAINYDAKELKDAMIMVLSNTGRLKEYKSKAAEFAELYTTEKIFDSAMEKSMTV